MKRTFNLWMTVGLLSCVGLMLLFHWRESQLTQGRLQRMNQSIERKEIANFMSLEMERFRRSYASFRRMDEGEISHTKTLHNERLNQSMRKLEESSPDETEKKWIAAVREKSAELSQLYAKIEPQLYSRDVYQKDEVKKAHESLLANLNEISDAAHQRIRLEQEDWNKGKNVAFQRLSAFGLLSAFFIVMILVRQYFLYFRPLTRLRQRAQAYQQALISSPDHNSLRLKGMFGEVEKIVKELSTTVHHQRLERHQFIAAVATDLRGPLVELQSAMLPATSGASESVKRATYRISKTLEELGEMVDLRKDGNIALQERVLDLGEFLESVKDQLSGVGSPYRMELQLPSASVWALMDRAKMERVIVHLMSKIMSYHPAGNSIFMGLKRSTQGEFRGVEILLRGGDVAPSVSRGSGITSPEVDALQHWISENGYGIASAHRMIQAHGGSLKASGVAGGSIQFIIRLPAERVTTGSVAMGLTSALETARVQPVFA